MGCWWMPLTLLAAVQWILRIFLCGRPMDPKSTQLPIFIILDVLGEAIQGHSFFNASWRRSRLFFRAAARFREAASWMIRGRVVALLKGGWSEIQKTGCISNVVNHWLNHGKAIKHIHHSHTTVASPVRFFRMPILDTFFNHQCAGCMAGLCLVQLSSTRSLTSVCGIPCQFKPSL